MRFKGIARSSQQLPSHQIIEVHCSEGVSARGHVDYAAWADGGHARQGAWDELSTSRSAHRPPHARKASQEGDHMGCKRRLPLGKGGT